MISKNAARRLQWRSFRHVIRSGTKKSFASARPKNRAKSSAPDSNAARVAGPPTLPRVARRPRDQVAARSIGGAELAPKPKRKGSVGVDPAAPEVDSGSDPPSGPSGVR